MFASSGRARFRVSVLLLVRFLSSPRITAAYQCQGGSTSALRVCACVCISYIVCWNTYENAMSMMYAIDVIDWPSFPFLEVVRDITYGVTYSSFFFFLYDR